MPYNNVPENMWDKMDRCVEEVMTKQPDLDKPAAIAICHTSIMGGKSIDTALADALKIGARNSRGDAQRLQMIHDYSVDNGAQCNPNNDMMNKSIDAETLTVYGAEVKALGDGKIGGYLVMFGSQTKRDLTGVDWFAPDTDFGNADKSAVYYHHGLDTTLKLRSLDDSATLRRDDVGVWIEAQLKMRDEYERAIYGMAQKGKLGWSSGTAPHLVARDETTGKITRWPLGLDASLTPTPAEPRIKAVPIKSLTTQPLTIETTPETAQENRSAESDHGAAVTSETTSQEITGEPTMSDEALNEIKALLTAQAEQMKAQAEKISALETVIKTAPTISTVPAASVKVIKDAADQPFESLGGFFKSVALAAYNPTQIDVRLSGLKAVLGANENIPSEGGFLLPNEQVLAVEKKIFEYAVLASRCDQRTIGMNANAVDFYGVDEDSRADGTRHGGVRGYRLAEGATITASQPKFYKYTLKPKKYAVLAYATSEVLQDSTLLEQEIMSAAPKELAFMLDDDIMNGLGASGPTGILVGPAKLEVSKESGQSAATVLAKNLSKMWARVPTSSKQNAVWFINTEVNPQLDELHTPTALSALPCPFVRFSDAGGVVTIKGRPTVETEFNAALGTAGDIVVADLSQYTLASKGGVMGAMSIHVAFLTDQSCFRWTARYDGQLKWKNALTPYKGSASATQSPVVALATRA